jgi:Domain of unknown function (DUF4388)
MRAKLTVGREGEIAVPPAEAEALGLSGGGEVALVSARGAFALLVPWRADAPRAFFAGSLAALTPPEVVQFVFTSLKTGVLLLAFGDEPARAAEAAGPERLRRKSIYFRDGQIVFASSSDPDDRLGPVLVRAGLARPDDVERCAALVRAGRPLGQVLVDEGLLDAGRLYQGVTLQVRDIVLGALVETSGEFAFLEGPFEERNAVKLAERTRELLLEGMRRRERAAGPDGATPDAAEAPDPPARAAASAPAPRHGGPFDAYRRIFRRVLAALAAVEADAAARLDSWLEALPATKRAVFEGVRFGGGDELEVDRVLANVNASGLYQGAAARARALEALEELLRFALFEAKNRLPRADAEALLREVGRMQVGKA